MSKGINVPTSFVPPVHTPSASEAFKRSHAPWSKSLPATALVCTWIITDQPLASDGADYISGCYASFIQRWSVSLRRKCSALGFRHPEPSPISGWEAGNPAGFWTAHTDGFFLPLALWRRPVLWKGESGAIRGTGSIFSVTPYIKIVSNLLPLFLPQDEQYPSSSVRHQSKRPSSES